MRLSASNGGYQRLSFLIGSALDMRNSVMDYKEQKICWNYWEG